VPEPEIVDLPEMAIAMHRETVPMSELPTFFALGYQAVASALDSQNVHVTGPPLGIYYSMPAETVDVGAGYPTDRPVETAGGVTAELLPAGQAAQILHIGSYDTLAETYARLMVWLSKQGHIAGPVMWESYLTEPNEHNPQTMQTLITWPLAE